MIGHSFELLLVPCTMSEDDGDDAVQCLEKPLKNIWEDDHIQRNKNDNSWTCLWCGKTMKPVHAKRAKSHVLKKDYRGVDSCSAIIPEADLLRYQDLWDR